MYRKDQMKGSFRDMKKHSRKVWGTTLLVCLIALGIFILDEMETELSLNSVACNASPTQIWLTITESGNKKAFSLPPGTCTDFFTQDAEAIWGNDCSAGTCRYQAWKVGAGRFTVEPGGNSSSAVILQIKGWGAGSRWQIASDWPKPELSSVNYSLVR